MERLSEKDLRTTERMVSPDVAGARGAATHFYLTRLVSEVRRQRRLLLLAFGPGPPSKPEWLGDLEYQELLDEVAAIRAEG